MSTKFAFGPDHAIASLSARNPAPKNTKIFILNLGYLRLDAGFLFAAGNSWTKSGGDPESHEKRDLIMYSVLIDHPSAGLILFETGPGIFDQYPDTWGPVCEFFQPVNRDESQALDKAISSVGYDIKDIKHVIIGHLHLDHAGGLQYFKGRKDVKIWVHEIEFKHAFWSVGTKIDYGAYLPYYLDLELNWETFSDPVVDIFPGLTVHLSPGHSPGLICLQVNLVDSGTIFFTSDHAHVSENYELDRTPGWLIRDHSEWNRSNQRLKRLQRLTNATLVFGHDVENVRNLDSLKKNGLYIT